MVHICWIFYLLENKKLAKLLEKYYITKNSIVIFWPFLSLNFIACSWNLLFCHLETGVGCIVRLALLKKAKLFFFQETFFSAKPKYRGWENALFIHKPITRQGKNVNCLKKVCFFPQVDRKYGYLKQQAMIPQWVNIGTRIHYWEIELFSSMLKPTFSFFNLLLNPSIFHFLPPTVQTYKSFNFKNVLNSGFLGIFPLDFI